MPTPYSAALAALRRDASPDQRSRKKKAAPAPTTEKANVLSRMATASPRPATLTARPASPCPRAHSVRALTRARAVPRIQTMTSEPRGPAAADLSGALSKS
jgi:hypothetical protein